MLKQLPELSGAGPQRIGLGGCYRPDRRGACGGPRGFDRPGLNDHVAFEGLLEQIGMALRGWSYITCK